MSFSVAHQFNSTTRKPKNLSKMMKSMVLLAIVAVAVAQTTPPIPILRQLIENENGVFKNNFETGNGIKVEESGSVKQVGPKPEDVGVVSRGSYSYTAPDNTVITVNWVADENGFQPTGAHLPVAPPMPEHVVKLLADLRAAGKL